MARKGRWPTPTQIDSTLKATGKVGSHGRHSVQLAHLANGGWINDDDWAKNRVWPTPQARDSISSQMPPTALIKNNDRQKLRPKGANSCLATEVVKHTWPTPRVSMANGPSAAEVEAGNPNCRLETAVAVAVAEMCPTPTTTGQLNPTWVEWLMGFPDGWTD